MVFVSRRNVSVKKKKCLHGCYGIKWCLYQEEMFQSRRKNVYMVMLWC